MRPTHLRVPAVILAAALSVSACSAGSGGTEAAESSEQTDITVALTGEPTNLDFTTTAGAAIPQALMSNVYEGLVEIDQEGSIQPLLAESWDISDDRRTYTFNLRPDVTFSNGEAFTADDVKFSIERVLSDAWVSSLKTKMSVVESVNVLGGGYPFPPVQRLAL
jgi:peptide/nickel transport system substrate-binding protein